MNHSILAKRPGLVLIDKKKKNLSYCGFCNVCIYQPLHWGCPCGVMVKAMDCEIVVSEFEFQLRYYVHFRVNTPGKGMNPLILPAMG